jgi:hypothetical protein
MQSFGTEPPLIDSISGTPTDADNFSFANANIERATIRAEDAG